MDAEHEKLLKQLFVTWDINKDPEKDFGFVKASVQGDTITYSREGSWIPLCRYKTMFVGQHEFELEIPGFLKRIVNFRNPRLEPVVLGREVVSFKVAGATLKCSGPIGVLVVDGAKRDATAFLDLCEIQK